MTTDGFIKSGYNAQINLVDDIGGGTTVIVPGLDSWKTGGGAEEIDLTTTADSLGGYKRGFFGLKSNKLTATCVYDDSVADFETARGNGCHALIQTYARISADDTSAQWTGSCYMDCSDFGSGSRNGKSVNNIVFLRAGDVIPVTP